MQAPMTKPVRPERNVTISTNFILYAEPGDPFCFHNPIPLLSLYLKSLYVREDDKLSLWKLIFQLSRTPASLENPPATRETWVWSLGWEDPLEKGKAIHASILVWRIPWTSPWGRKESNTTERLSLHKERKQPGEQGRNQGLAFEFNFQWGTWV